MAAMLEYIGALEIRLCLRVNRCGRPDDEQAHEHGLRTQILGRNAA